MTADTAALGILVDASQARTAASVLGRLKDSAGAAEAATGLLTRAFAGLSAGMVVGKLVSVQRTFDVLNSSMRTVTGSAEAAAREFEWIRRFAAETPFGLQEAANAFVKMKALGIEPTEDSLRSFGNTASAMGKTLNQFVEAVADASTSEFERLKEFGIKAKKDGETVSLTFQGVTTTIGNNSREIVKYLDDIGNHQFAGAMSERAKTLDGAISALGDTWDDLFLTINQQSAGGLIHDSVKLASGAIEDAIAIIKSMNTATAESTQQTGAMKTVQEGIATVFETVAVVGANVAYVFERTGAELGGLAAQAVALGKLDFEGAKVIGDAMKEDAAAARKEVDRLTESILGARNGASKAAASLSQTGRAGDAANDSMRAANSSAEALGAANKGDKASEWLRKYATDAEKLAAELKKAREELGSGFSPDIVGRVVDKFSDREGLGQRSREARADAATLRAQGRDARDSLFDRAEGRRQRGLSEEDRSERAQRQASSLGARATLSAGDAFAALRDGDLKRAQRLAEDATKLAERAGRAAENIADDDTAARQLEELGRLREKIGNVQAGLKDAEADQIDQAKARIDGLITALTTPVSLNLDIADAVQKIAQLQAQINSLGNGSSSAAPISTPATGSNASGSTAAQTTPPTGGYASMGGRTVTFDSAGQPSTPQPPNNTISWTRDVQREAKRVGR